MISCSTSYNNCLMYGLLGWSGSCSDNWWKLNWQNPKMRTESTCDSCIYAVYDLLKIKLLKPYAFRGLKSCSKIIWFTAYFENWKSSFSLDLSVQIVRIIEKIWFIIILLIPVPSSLTLLLTFNFQQSIITLMSPKTTSVLRLKKKQLSHLWRERWM